MPIAAPIRKGLKARKIAQDRPELSEHEIAKLVGSNKGYIAIAISKETFGRDKPKSRV